jgi:hypothetical protein
MQLLEIGLDIVKRRAIYNTIIEQAHIFSPDLGTHEGQGSLGNNGHVEQTEIPEEPLKGARCASRSRNQAGWRRAIARLDLARNEIPQILTREPG